MSASESKPRIALVTRYVAWAGICARCTLSGFLLWFDVPWLVALNVLSIAIWVCGKALNDRAYYSLAMWLLYSEAMIHAVVMVEVLGQQSGFQYYLIPLVPYVTFNERLAPPSIVAGAVLPILVFVGLAVGAPVDSPSLAELPVRPLNLILPLVSLALISNCFRSASRDIERTMTRIASTDPLTGLFNRRAMRIRLEQAEDCRRRSNVPFSLVLADIDHFKRINDAYGHAVGDAVLCAVGSLLGRCLRAGDCVARWGGEEFLILLPDTELPVAEELTSRLRAGVCGYLREVSDLPSGVTLTFGVAAPDAQASVEDCLNAADAALYQGKSEGRDRVVAAGSLSPPNNSHSPRDDDEQRGGSQLRR